MGTSLRTDTKVLARIRRHKRIRASVSGTAMRPRLAVFRSNRFIYAQLIDDVSGITLGFASDMKETKGTKSERSKLVGEAIAKIALAKGLSSIVFDRGGNLYTGRVQILADSARAAGLAF
jgi:large subunit ribosomal protein L18